MINYLLCQYRTKGVLGQTCAPEVAFTKETKERRKKEERKYKNIYFCINNYYKYGGDGTPSFGVAMTWACIATAVPHLQQDSKLFGTISSACKPTWK